MKVAQWLPEGKRAAIVFSIDDIHPGRSCDAYEAGGDLGKGALRHVEWLHERHRDLKTTLFTTPDWREISPVPTRKTLARIPLLRDRFFLSRVHPKGTMHLARHPEFVAYLRSLDRVQVAVHGLHHVHTGPRLPVEFQDQSASECTAILKRSLAIFHEAGLEPVLGITPPGWNLTDGLAQALLKLRFKYVASARDIRTPISAEARTAMSGLEGVPLIYPALLYGDRLVHIASNYQATSDRQRATDILELGGLLAIKAHIIKSAMGHVALDGLDESYRDHLHRLFSALEERYAEQLWWTSMDEVADRVLESVGLK